MTKFPKRLQTKLNERAKTNALRSLGSKLDGIDFSSNDYLGYSDSTTIFNRASHLITKNELRRNGATGSRLLSGNHALYNAAESFMVKFHQAEAALIYNSGYDANLGFFSSVPQRGDVIVYDKLCHASIRDGIIMSHAKAYKFTHNDSNHLKELLSKGVQSRTKETELYVVTESVFSMDGDRPDLKNYIEICQEYGAHLIVDEAHALGVYGEKGEGIVQNLELESAVFARIVTFGKGLGSHGAAILGSATLKSYLINFSRSLIYSTGLPPHAVASILAGYQTLEEDQINRNKLISNIAILRKYIVKTELDSLFIESDSAIHCCLIPGNHRVKQISEALKERGFDVKPILSPTVPKGAERLRICIHSFNTEEEISNLISHLANLLQ